MEFVNHCDWKAFYRSISSHPQHIRIQLTKYNAKLLPVGRNLLRRKHSASDLCPCCGQEEDHLHIIRCKHEEMVAALQEHIVSIKEWLSNGTSSDIADGVLALLCDFLSPYSGDEEGGDSTLEHQQRLLLGQKAFFAGL